MAKLVTLKIGNHTSEGLPVLLQIAAEHTAPNGQSWLQIQAEVPGQLPPATDLLQDYFRWQSTYRILDIRHRLEADPGQTKNVSYVSLIEECQLAAKQFQTHLDRWLKVDSFRPIRERLFGSVMPTEEVRLVVQVDDPQLQRLPWHLGYIFERYEQTEVILASPEFEEHPLVKTADPKVRILAILGDSQGIDTQHDRKVLEQLPNATVHFLVEPNHQQLSNELWRQHWDILFFAGHSSSQDNAGTGRININPKDSLTIEQLTFALKTAISKGLRIAIFNSCDGLGLARSLADLRIPQVVVMREPVPDRVAQTFLKCFLTQFSNGESFYKSIREAREKLQSLEQDCPCATWLPVVYQNLMALPPTWEQLRGEPQKKQRRFRIALLASAITTGAILGARFFGLLQPIELSTFDQTLRLRPSESKDSRLLVVEITEDDWRKQADKPQQGGSLSNYYLNALLEKLRPAEPITIGLDIYRDKQSSQGFKALNDALMNQEMITVCRVKDPAKNEAEVPPAPEVRDNQALGFSDTLTDTGSPSIVRRQLLSMGEESNPGATCNPPYALSLQLAYQYLYPGAPELKTEKEVWKWGSATLNLVKKQTGGYQRFDDRGAQILLNYRSTQEGVRDAIPSMTMQQVLQMKPEDLKRQVENRIVLIGTTAETFKDVAMTPYPAPPKNSCVAYECIPGVFLQAQMTSQLVSAVLGERPLLWALPSWADGIIVVSCTLAGVLVAWRVGRIWILGAIVGGMFVLLAYTAVHVLTHHGIWFPLVPSALALVISTSCVKVYKIKGL